MQGPGRPGRQIHVAPSTEASISSGWRAASTDQLGRDLCRDFLPRNPPNREPNGHRAPTRPSPRAFATLAPPDTTPGWLLVWFRPPLLCRPLTSGKAEAEVVEAALGRVPVPRRRAHAAREVCPGATTDHTHRAHWGALRVHGHTGGTVALLVPRQFPNVAQHAGELKGIGRLHTHRMRTTGPRSRVLLLAPARTVEPT